MARIRIQQCLFAIVAAAMIAAMIAGDAVFAQDGGVTAERYAAAQIIYQAENLRRLSDAAQNSPSGVADASVVTLGQFPSGAVEVAVHATSDGAVVFTVSGTGAYRVTAVAYGSDRAVLQEFSGSEFTVRLADLEVFMSLALNIAYLPAETPTFFEPPKSGENTMLARGGVTLLPVVGTLQPSGRAQTSGGNAIETFNVAFDFIPAKTEVTQADVTQADVTQVQPPGERPIGEQPPEILAEQDTEVIADLEFADGGVTGGEDFDGGGDVFDGGDFGDFDGNDLPIGGDGGLFESCITAEGNEGTFDENGICQPESAPPPEEEFFIPDASAPVIPDYEHNGDRVIVTVPLEELFQFNETPLVASLIFSAPNNPSRQLEFLEPIDGSAVTFTIPNGALATLGDAYQVLLKLQSDMNGLSVVSTDVLGMAHN